MTKIINQPSLGSLLGQGFGTGLGQGLELLANQKLQQLAQRQLIPNITPQESSALQLLPQQTQNQLLNQKLQQPSLSTYQQSLSELLNPQKALDELRIPPQLSEKQSTELTKLALGEKTKKQKAESAEQSRIDKLTQPFYTKTIEKAESAKPALKRLDRMKELIHHGSLPISAFYNGIKGIREFESHIPLFGKVVNAVINSVGGVLDAVQKGIFATDTEEFEKLSNDFVREAKNIYGNRITNFELDNFMKLIPTLSQTDKGKLAIIRNLENMFQADKVKEKALKQVIKENKGKRPSDLEFQVEKRSKKKLDQLAKKFVSGAHARESKELSRPPQKNIREQNREFLENALSTYISPGLTNLIHGL